MRHSTWFKQSALSLAIMTAGLGTISTPVMAQIESATLGGKITTQNEMPKAGIEVTAVDTKRGYSKTTTTRADGSYLFIGLKPGNYNVTVGDEAGEQIQLLVGQSARLNFSVEDQSTGGVEHIAVTGVRVEAFSGGEVGTNITPEMMAHLPQGNRNFLAFADLAPGVQLETANNGNISLRGGAQHQRAINVFLDGVSQKDYVLKGGITGQDSSNGNPFPQGAIGEYKVITQNYKAEYDQVSSAAISAVTRSGTNEFEGDLFVDYTNQDFREAEPNEEEGKTVSLTRHYGGTLSGPIIKDKLHFLVTYERKDIKTPQDVIGGANIEDFTLPAEYQAMLGSHASDFSEDLFFGKIDWSISDDQTLEASVKVRDESDIVGFGGANTQSYGTDRTVKDNRANIKHTFYADEWQNEIRFTYEDVSWAPTPYTNAPGMVLQNAERQTLLNVGGGRNFQDKGQKGWSIQDDFTWLDLEWNGYHVIKAGIKYKSVKLNTIQQQPYNPQYYYNVEFNSEGMFDLVQPYRVEWGLPVAGTDAQGRVESDNSQLGLYIQDDWEVTDRLILNLGVRWDYEKSPSFTDFKTPTELVTALHNWSNIQNTDYDIDDFISTGKERDNYTGAWQPRLGFSYALGEERNHTLYGGWGRSYDRNQFDYIQLETSKNTFASVSYLFQGDASNPCDASSPSCVAWDPKYLTQSGLNELISEVEVRGENNLISNDLKMPYSDQSSLGIRSSWGDWNTDVSVTRIESHDGFNWLLGNRRENGEFFAEGASWGSPWGFPTPGYGNLILGVNGGETRSTNLYVKLDHPHIDNWDVQVAYTFSDSEENRVYSEVYALDYPSVEDYGWNKSVGVPEHRLVLTGGYDMPWDMYLSAKYTWASETTFQYLDCHIDNQHCYFDRVEPSESDYSQLDISLSKEFGSEFMVEGSSFHVRFDVLNLFNTKNYRTFITGWDSDDFGEPNPTAQTRGLRQVKLSAGWKF
ncbi:TonB-dependent receptor domain-containing protein [Neptunicella sp. SCSIO 80796]|uniref:TonB-dependent receptor domain-containing protein n=1 Tax=Neptunicella plasticusilytica TaxID=3117012 RepID=UPI003A4D6E6B